MVSRGVQRGCPVGRGGVQRRHGHPSAQVGGGGAPSSSSPRAVPALRPRRGRDFPRTGPSFHAHRPHLVTSTAQQRLPHFSPTANGPHLDACGISSAPLAHPPVPHCRPNVIAGIPHHRRPLAHFTRLASLGAPTPSRHVNPATSGFPRIFLACPPCPQAFLRAPLCQRRAPPVAGTQFAQLPAPTPAGGAPARAWWPT